MRSLVLAVVAAGGLSAQTVIELPAPVAATAQYSRGKWSGLSSLRSVFQVSHNTTRVLAYATGPAAGTPRFAFAAMDETAGYEGRARAVQRSVVVLEGGTAVTFDFVSGVEADTQWRMGAGEGTRLLTPTGSEGGFLSVMGAAGELVRGADLAGARVGEWVVLFHTESQVAGSAVSFLVPGQGRVRILVTGLAPGTWEVWRNGWVVEGGGMVKRAEFCLYFEGEAGDYFLRHLN